MVVTLSVTAYVATILALIYHSIHKPLNVLSKTSTDQAIRVVNAFRQGLDSRGSLADAALAEALRKQTALSKRFSHSSSIDYADTARDTLAPHDIDVERLSSHSHTETAV